MGGIEIAVAVMVFMTIVLVVALYVLFKVLMQMNRMKQDSEALGIPIFTLSMKEYDFISFVNTCISYLLCNGELDLNTFLSKDILRVTPNSDYILLERMINKYPIIDCSYVGRGIYIVNPNGVADNCEKYQSETGNDDFIIPLFDDRLISNYDALFNMPTKYQQMKVADMVVKAGKELTFDFDDPNVSNDALSILKENKKLDTSYIVNRRRRTTCQ